MNDNPIGDFFLILFRLLILLVLMAIAHSLEILAGG